MYSLSFYPEYDSHHAIFRYFCFAPKFPRMRLETYRIVDYFYLNPFDLHTIRTSGNKHRQIAKQFDHLRPYRRLSEPAGLAIQMWQFQQGALAALGRRGFVSPSGLASDVVAWAGPDAMDSSMLVLAEADRTAKADVLEFLQSFVSRHQVGGPGGIKDRSGILDYRYDVKNAAAA